MQSTARLDLFVQAALLDCAYVHTPLDPFKHTFGVDKLPLADRFFGLGTSCTVAGVRLALNTTRMAQSVLKLALSGGHELNHYSRQELNQLAGRCATPMDDHHRRWAAAHEGKLVLTEAAALHLLPFELNRCAMLRTLSELRAR